MADPHRLMAGVALLGLGATLGWWAKPSPSADTETAPDPDPASASASASASDPAASEAERESEAETEAETETETEAEAESARGSGSRSVSVRALPPLADDAPPDALRRRVQALELERRELLGDAIERDPRSPTPPRFTRSALATAFRAALREEDIEGDIEGVDCSEYPCIVLGRLVGDEEDVEELERSEALAPYRNDVLTLLLWAASVRDEDRSIDEAPESALFAIAFYEEAEREALGPQLDRRIRARVMEVWNTDRPGRFDRDPTE